MKFMAARNDITGKVIKTNPQSTAYAEGWDKIYAKKTANEWLKYIPDTIIYDPDGWRYDDITLDTPISWKEFQKRLSESTVIGKRFNDE